MISSNGFRSVLGRVGAGCKCQEDRIVKVDEDRYKAGRVPFGRSSMLVAATSLDLCRWRRGVKEGYS